MNQVTSTGSDIDRDEPGTIWTQLRRVAAADGDKVAYVTVDDDGMRADVSYSAMVDAAEALAAGLLELGVRRGERVGVWMTNRVDWLRTYFAVMRLGAVLVPLNTWLKPNEVEFVLRHAGVRHLVTLDRFRQLDFVGALDPVHPELAQLDTVIVARRTAGAGPAHRFLDLHDARIVPGRPAPRRGRPRRRSRRPRVHQVHVREHRVPQGRDVDPRRHPAQRPAAHGAAATDGSDDRFFSSMPFFHGGGSVWGIATMLSRGGTLVFTEAFDPPLAARLLESERCTVFFGVLGNEVLAAARTDHRDLSSVRMSMTGGADAAELMPNSRPIIRPFGLTEMLRARFAGRPRRPAGQAARHARPPARRQRDPCRRSGHRPRRPDGHGRRSVGARQHHARLLERSRRPRQPPSTPTAGCTAATSSASTTRATSRSSAGSS